MVQTMPDAFGRPTPEEAFVNLLQVGNAVLSVIKGLDTLDRAVARGRAPAAVAKDLLQQLDDAIKRGQEIEKLRPKVAPFVWVQPRALPSGAFW